MGLGKGLALTAPLPALEATAFLLGCPQTGWVEEDKQGAQLETVFELASHSSRLGFRLFFVPELIYFLSTSDVCYLDF